MVTKIFGFTKTSDFGDEACGGGTSGIACLECLMQTCLAGEAVEYVKKGKTPWRVQWKIDLPEWEFLRNDSRGTLWR